MKYKRIKYFTLFSSAIIFFVACDKGGTIPPYKVEFTVTGDSVTHFAFSLNAYGDSVQTPFSGTRDTIVYVQFGANLQLDAKAVDSNLAASIYVNDVLQATGTDKDSNGDGKTEVKIGYTISTP